MAKGAFTPEELGQNFLRIAALPKTPEAIDYAIQHTGDPRMQNSLVDAVLIWMKSHPSDARAQWIGQLIQDPEFADTALETVESRPFPRIARGVPGLTDAR